MWQINQRIFDNADDLIAFIQSADFASFIKQMDHFDLVVKETACRVASHLSSRKPILYDQDRLSDVDWETTYEVSHLRSEDDPNEMQQQALDILQRIVDIINQQLNEE